jgi:hypothetical protein
MDNKQAKEPPRFDPTEMLTKISMLDARVATLEAKVLGNVTTGFSPVTLAVTSVQTVAGRGLVAQVTFVQQPQKLYPEDVLASDSGEWRISGIEMAHGAFQHAKVLGLVLVELSPGKLEQGSILRKIRGRS